MKDSRVYLVGFMGAGKTTVGKKLAIQLDWPFIDLDLEIEKDQDMPIPRIFRRYGEASFRQLELKWLDRVSRRDPPLVVSCGGGVPLKSRNRKIMNQSGVPIYLSVTANTAWERIEDDDNRPLAQSREKFETLLRNRQEIYENIPHKIDVNDKSPDQVIESIVRMLNRVSLH